MDSKARLYVIADELRSMATLTDYFDSDPYQRERAERMTELAAEIAGIIDSDEDPAAIKEHFERKPWHRVSPVAAVDAFVLNEKDELLLIQRADNGTWATPGGIAEVGKTLSESALIELWEEAGLKGRVERLLGVFDSRLWGTRKKLHGTHFTYLVSVDDLNPVPGTETLDARFYPRDAVMNLPLHGGHEQRIPAAWDALLGGYTQIDKADAIEMELPNHQRPQSSE